MSKELVKLHAEVTRLATVYQEYKDSQDYTLRKKAHLDLDRFLMENREVAIVLMEQRLKELTKKSKRRWFSAATWRINNEHN